MNQNGEGPSSVGKVNAVGPVGKIVAPSLPIVVINVTGIPGTFERVKAELTSQITTGTGQDIELVHKRKWRLKIEDLRLADLNTLRTVGNLTITWAALKLLVGRADNGTLIRDRDI